MLRQPIDLDPVDASPERARDRDVALRVAEADGRRDVEHALGPAPSRTGRPRSGLALEAGLEKLAERVIHLHGLSHHRPVARACTASRRVPSVAARASPSANGVIRSPVPWSTSVGH